MQHLEVRIIDRFKGLILRTCGFSMEQAREQALRDALQKRMAEREITAPEAYYTLLTGDRDEFHRLIELLTVNETYFFREPDHLNMMAGTLIPELLAQRSHRPLRILSAGCSTGEEPYSIAMILRQRYGDDCTPLFSITGVDIDATAVATARRGLYGKGSFRGIDGAVMDRFFESAGRGEYRVRPEVRNSVTFHEVNLLSEPYPDDMLLPDIIFYRNVSIYFPPQVQREIFSSLATLLRDGGFLIVGATETLHHNLGILSLTERESLFFYRKTAQGAARPAAQPRHAPPPVRPAAAGRPVRPAAGELKKQVPTEDRRKPVRPEHAEDAAAALADALEQARKGLTEAALTLLDGLIRQDADCIRALALKASLLMELSRLDEAADLCRRTVSLDPVCLDAYLMLGVIARHRGDNEEALRRFREAVYLEPSCWLAHFYTADILFTRGDAKRARSGYESASRILEKQAAADSNTFFPLAYNADQFIVICRHKLSQLKENG